jgi:soluble lytic murein transglycosylase-like protein
MRNACLVLVACVLHGVTAGGIQGADLPSHSNDPYWYVNHPCLSQAGTRYRLSPRILEAIVYVEARGNPYAVSVNQDGKGHSQGLLSLTEARGVVSKLWAEGKNFDVGMAQINSQHAKRYGIHPVVFLDPCVNLSWAAFILRQQVNRFNETWEAVGHYNGSRNVKGYSWKVYQALGLLAPIVRDRQEGAR